MLTRRRGGRDVDGRGRGFAGVGVDAWDALADESVGVMTPDVVNASSSGVSSSSVVKSDPLGWLVGLVSGALSSPSTSPVGTSSTELLMRCAEETRTAIRPAGERSFACRRAGATTRRGCRVTTKPLAGRSSVRWGLCTPVVMGTAR